MYKLTIKFCDHHASSRLKNDEIIYFTKKCQKYEKSSLRHVYLREKCHQSLIFWVHNDITNFLLKNTDCKSFIWILGAQTLLLFENNVFHCFSMNRNFVDDASSRFWIFFSNKLIPQEIKI